MTMESWIGMNSELGWLPSTLKLRKQCFKFSAGGSCLRSLQGLPDAKLALLLLLGLGFGRFPLVKGNPNEENAW